MHQFRQVLTTITKPFDTFLNSFTMYKVVLGGLSLIAAFAIILSGFELLPFGLLPGLLALTLFVVGSFVLNVVLSKLLQAPINVESSAITGLILFLIFTPPTNMSSYLMAISAIVVAMTSKYILAIRKKHLFNPAAIAALIVMIIGFDGASWWVATPMLFPVTLVVGLMVVRKIRRFSLFTAFIVAAFVSIFYHNWSMIAAGFTSPQELISQVLLSWPLLFFGTIMLTEPYTMPPTRKLQIVFGVLVGLLFGARFEIGPFFATPELALLIGNVFAYIVSPKQRLFLQLITSRKLSDSIYEFAFSVPQNSNTWFSPRFSFKPGQYLEWTIPIETAGTPPDSRGNRRFFTIASSPTEQNLLLGVKIPDENPSYYKQALKKLKPGDTIVGAQLAGDFTLNLSANSDKQNHLVFIAGGIGVTPFRSMIQYLVDSTASGKYEPKNLPNITLLYCASQVDDIVYEDIFETATQKIPFTPVYIITRPEKAPEDWQGETGRLTPETIKKYIPDYVTATYYVSGPNAMVDAYKSLLAQMQVPSTQIKEDYFPGF